MPDPTMHSEQRATYEVIICFAFVFNFPVFVSSFIAIKFPDGVDHFCDKRRNKEFCIVLRAECDHK